MARGDLIVNLVKAGASGDQKLVRTVAEEIAANERSQTHDLLADRIVRALSASSSKKSNSCPDQVVWGLERAQMESSVAMLSDQ